MITIGYSTRESKPEFIEYLKTSSGYAKNVRVIEKVNNGEKSLSQVYNEILNESQSDIVIFCHDDIYFDSNGWYHKILKHFEKTDYGILGVAGTKFMSENGTWWSDRRKMYGVVNHESGGKKWESKYSTSLGNGIDDVVVLDGVFLVVHKNRINHNFVEEFEGFHFYDIPFCFENFLSGVKLGVMYNVRITHKSVGMTNEQWEINRKKFEEKYNQSLPQKLALDPKTKLKILFTCLSFKTLTGSELYVYQLAKSLKKMGHDVSVMSEIGGPLTDMAKKDGIKVYSIREPLGYKLGDGKWGFQNGEISQPNVLYPVGELMVDLIHTQHKPITEHICRLYPNVPKISTIHSEVIDLENPYVHESIKKYIAIRPEIKDYLITEHSIPEEKIRVIYNPIDNTKFKSSTTSENYVLFVGTLDYLRKNTIFDLVEKTKEKGMKLVVVGEDKSIYLNDLKSHSHVEYHPATWSVEKYVSKCKETAGIQLGRTTIEGWISGKPGWIYKVDDQGNILDIEYHEPPSDVDKYYSDNVSNQIIDEYFTSVL
jgi:glycosyltransferase involved in cell wall biosynthesis